MTDAMPVARSLRIMVVEDDPMVSESIGALLENLGHSVVARPADAEQALDAFREQEPQLVIMDVRLNGDDGIDLTRKLLRLRSLPVVILSAHDAEELIQRAADAGVFGYLIKPVTRQALAAAITVAIRRFNEQTRLLLALEKRKLMDRAKGILMKRLNLSESDAHKRLQAESQNRRVSMAEICKKVIESEELLSQ